MGEREGLNNRGDRDKIKGGINVESGNEAEEDMGGRYLPGFHVESPSGWRGAITPPGGGELLGRE